MPTQLSLFDPPGEVSPASSRETPRETAPEPASPAIAPVEDRSLDALRAEVAARTALQTRLAAAIGRPVESVVLTRNRTRIVTALPGRRGLRIRIHQCFTLADDAVVAAVAEFLSTAQAGRRQVALEAIRAHFAQHGRPAAPPRRSPSVTTRGRCFDLEALRDRVNHDYFEGRLQVAITWGRGAQSEGFAAFQAAADQLIEALGVTPRRSRRPRREESFHIRLGSYHERDNLVRIHPVLDRADVPEFVVESIVHHEMLHAALPPERGKGGRRRVHTAEFRRRERLFARHEEAEAWIRQNVERLARQRYEV
jgi:hypothetical protein